MLSKLRSTRGRRHSIRLRLPARCPARWPWASKPARRAMLAAAGVLALAAWLLTLWWLAGPQPPWRIAGLLPGKAGDATPTARPLWTPGPLPTAAPTQEPDGFNLLLLGCDRANPSWRTDVIMVAAIRPQAGFVGLFSIPRDLWVTIPGYGKERINTADYRGEMDSGSGGGPALLAATLQENLGIGTQAYVRIAFDGLVRVVDALGGVDITSDRAYPKIGVQVGTQHMDGKLALAYARDRTYTSDLDRLRRQQQLLVAMRQAAQRPTVLLQLPRLLATLPDVVQTDLSPAQVWLLAGLGLRLKPEAIRTRTFDPIMVDSWTTPDGAMVLLPHRDLIEQAWRQVTAAQ